MVRCLQREKAFIDDVINNNYLIDLYDNLDILEQKDLQKNTKKEGKIMTAYEKKLAVAKGLIDEINLEAYNQIGKTTHITTMSHNWTELMAIDTDFIFDISRLDRTPNNIKAVQYLIAQNVINHMQKLKNKYNEEGKSDWVEKELKKLENAAKTYDEKTAFYARAEITRNQLQGQYEQTIVAINAHFRHFELTFEAVNFDKEIQIEIVNLLNEIDPAQLATIDGVKAAVRFVTNNLNYLQIEFDSKELTQAAINRGLDYIESQLKNDPDNRRAYEAQRLELTAWQGSQ